MNKFKTASYILTINDYEERGMRFYDLLLDLIRLANETKEFKVEKWTNLLRKDCDVPYVLACASKKDEGIYEITFENAEIYEIFRKIHKNLNKFYDEDDA